MKRNRCWISGNNSAAIVFLRSTKTQLVDLFTGLVCRQSGKTVDRETLHPHVTRDRVQTRPVATRTLVRFFLLNPFKLAIGRQFIFQD